MPVFPPRKQWVAFLFLVVLFLVGVVFLFGGLKGKGHLPYGERIIFKILGPFSKKAISSGLGLKKLFRHYIWLRHTQEENERLKLELAHLEAELVKAREHELEYERLKRLLKIARRFKTPRVAARVIGRPLGHWQGLVIVDKGLRDGVSPEMPVVYYTPQGPGALVGQVVAAAEHYAKILLITDPSSAVDVFVQRSRQRGLLRGKGGALCMLDYVPAEADVREKDVVITSGLDGIYPKGILVGQVSRIYPGREKGLFRLIEVTPAAPLKDLEEVLIILKRPLP